MITFSVITITYNAAPVLQATLDSVLMQDYPHVEHLIIDGASTDETVQVAESYRQQSAETDNEHVVRIQSEPDNGLYDAMNKGLRLATAKSILPSSSAIRTSSTRRATSSAIAGSVRPNASPGVPSATACWCAIRRSTPARTSPGRCRMTPATAIQQT